MKNYFTHFPFVKHDLKNDGKFVVLTNILRRFKFSNKAELSADVWYPYTLYEEDRPDIIAKKYYGDSKLHWVILLFNQILDPHFQWPMNTVAFENYIKGKYGSRSSAKATIHEYRWILQEEKMLFDGTKLDKVYVIVDETTANTIDEIHKEVITKWDWESEENEKRRTIKILDRMYLPQVLKEVTNVLRAY
jgi:hypothetical protein